MTTNQNELDNEHELDIEHDTEVLDLALELAALPGHAGIIWAIIHLADTIAARP